MVSGGWAGRAPLVGVLLLATLIGAGCCVFRPPVACVNIEATLAYYYRYSDANPDLSDIAFIEIVPPGPRCIIGSAKRAPVFPDAAISDVVRSGAMKIDVPDAKNVQIQGKATIAVYYKGNVSSPSRDAVAVESLWGISRVIETVSVIDTGTPACGGGCPSVPCDGYACCKRPPCP
jgi:hypothetical protein